MAFCRKCGKEIDEEAIICIHCGCATGNAVATQKESTDREANGGELLVAFLFPIVGAILYYIYKADKPTAAQKINKISIAAFFMWFALGLLYGSMKTIFL